VLIKKNIFIFALIIFPFISNGQEEIETKIDPSKSWGVGMIAHTANFSEGFGLSLFYQKNKFQYNLEFHSSNRSNLANIKFSFYPNDWRKRLDLRVEAGFGWNQLNTSFIKNQFQLMAGYGLRWRILKHFYLTHSFNLGLNYYNYPDFYNQSEVTLATYNYLNVGLLINLGSIRWKKD